MPKKVARRRRSVQAQSVRSAYWPAHLGPCTSRALRPPDKSLGHLVIAEREERRLLCHGGRRIGCLLGSLGQKWKTRTIPIQTGKTSTSSCVAFRFRACSAL